MNYMVKMHPTLDILVSSLGEFLIPARHGQHDYWTKGGKSVHGYMIVGGGDGKQYRAHRLVLETFIGPCPEGCEADHIDRCRDNNALNNLRWIPHRKNLLNRHVCDTCVEKYGFHSSDNKIAYMREWRKARKLGGHNG